MLRNVEKCPVKETAFNEGKAPNMKNSSNEILGISGMQHPQRDPYSRQQPQIRTLLG
jgi:hypothetical protein